jgi:hypothetical protein
MAFNIQLYKEVTQVTTAQDTALGIMKWGLNNAFPQTLKNLIEQSPCAKPAVGRTAKFYKGAGFEGEDEIVNPYGLTLKKVVSMVADDYAGFEAFCIHCNYNIKGEVTSMLPISIEDARFNEFDELNYASKIGYHPDFGGNSEVQKTVTSNVTRGKIKWINRFNPETVIEQIEKTRGKISNYQGQALYYSEAGHSSYPISPLQAPINYLLSDIENSILVRKETSTGFLNSYLLKTTLAATDPNLIALEEAIAQAQGARGTGKVITMSGLAPEDMENTVLEEIGAGAKGSGAAIDAATKAFNLAQKVINAAYLIPPILSGADQKTGFSSADLKEAYFVFNATTQIGRDIIESEINRILKVSIFKTKSIKINKLRLDETEISDNNSVIPPANV